MSEQHIPAWKRLGLQLKFANERIASTSSESETHIDGRKRKQETDSSPTHGLDDKQRQLKKTRVEHSPSKTKLSRDTRNIDTKLSALEGPKRKKSVTFAPETKDEDGNTAQTIQFWVPDSPGSTPKKPSKSDDAPQLTDSKKRLKREKKPRSLRPAASNTQRKGIVALSYLCQFHQQRPAWKFNKNHDTWIMKNILSAEDIPPEHNLALASYLQGMKSDRAKERLTEQSREALKADELKLQEETDLQEKLTHACEVSPSNVDDPDEVLWVKDLGRPQLVLLSLRQSLTGSHKQGSTNGQPPQRVKKNKSRTARIEIESSSSDSSDSDEDSEDGLLSSESRKATSSVNKQSLNEAADQTSSSDTSSANSSTEVSGDSAEDSDTSSDEE